MWWVFGCDSAEAIGWHRLRFFILKTQAVVFSLREPVEVNKEVEQESFLGVRLDCGGKWKCLGLNKKECFCFTMFGKERLHLNFEHSIFCFGYSVVTYGCLGGAMLLIVGEYLVFSEGVCAGRCETRDNCIGSFIILLILTLHWELYTWKSCVYKKLLYVPISS